ncbi:hypothetical protein BRADI_2g32545v3 [Brachypodium distachyon]|uniref:Uncharacterized protein n=1 Tax=Brachypodium distachyon TaxID=15368 RepID=A0A2K2DBG9_BRADI|nr:hypothetical protein BRADI_2g32545v3 [Brachypodium distachyon]
MAPIQPSLISSDPIRKLQTFLFPPLKYHLHGGFQSIEKVAGPPTDQEQHELIKGEGSRSTIFSIPPHEGTAGDDGCGHRTPLASSGSLLPNGITPDQHKAEHHKSKSKPTTNMYKRIPSTSPKPTPEAAGIGPGRPPPRLSPLVAPQFACCYCSGMDKDRSCVHMFSVNMKGIVSYEEYEASYTATLHF